MTAVGPARAPAAARPAAVGVTRGFPLLDGYRALAASAVVVTHVGFNTGAALNGHAAGLLARLDIGVALFFLISGFLLFRPWALSHLLGTPRPAAGPYLWRRALRVLPALWVAVLGVSLLVPENGPVSLPTWFAQLSLLQTYLPVRELLGLSPLWSLATEVAFYLVLPLLGAALVSLAGGSLEQRMRRAVLGLLALTVVPLLFRALVLGGEVPARDASFWLPAYLDWFVLGMFLALVRAYRELAPHTRRWSLLEDLAAAPGACWAAAAAVYVVASTQVAGPRSLLAPTAFEATAKHWLYAAAAFLMLLPGVLGDPADGRIRSLLGSRPLRFVGDVSYGIFLWNMPVLFLVFRLLHLTVFDAPFWRTLAVVYGLTLAVATASHYLVERPFLRLKDRLPGRPTRSAQATAASARS
ncbi:MAG TPA: acyltransferase [Motilibacteraceae bacterium]|nr:acyltransferase [Motilibacteraceae bacterium]